MPVKPITIVNNNFPNKLIKIFSKESHRADFLSGIFRMGEINGYKSIEDKQRQDKSEGTAEYQYKDMVQTIHVNRDNDITQTTEESGLMRMTATFGNPVYLFCTATEKAKLAYLKGKFGNYAVEIKDPHALACDLTDYYNRSGYRLAGDVRVREVIYDKGGVKNIKPESHQNTELTYTQKPNNFEDEYEFRYVAVLHRLEEHLNHIEINLGKRITYATAI